MCPFWAMLGKTAAWPCRRLCLNTGAKWCAQCCSLPRRALPAASRTSSAPQRCVADMLCTLVFPCNCCRWTRARPACTCAAGCCRAAVTHFHAGSLRAAADRDAVGIHWVLRGRLAGTGWGCIYDLCTLYMLRTLYMHCQYGYVLLGQHIVCCEAS